MDLHLTLRCLGMPAEDPSFMFGDNHTVIDVASFPRGKSHKRHIALSFHRTRFTIATGVVRHHHVASDRNPADILSEHWDFRSVWPQLYPLLFWPGDTADLIPSHQPTSQDVPVLDDKSKESKDGAQASPPQDLSAPSHPTQESNPTADSPVVEMIFDAVRSRPSSRGALEDDFWSCTTEL